MSSAPLNRNNFLVLVRQEIDRVPRPRRTPVLQPAPSASVMESASGASPSHVASAGGVAGNGDSDDDEIEYLGTWVAAVEAVGAVEAPRRRGKLAEKRKRSEPGGSRAPKRHRTALDHKDQSDKGSDGDEDSDRDPKQTGGTKSKSTQRTVRDEVRPQSDKGASRNVTPLPRAPRDASSDLTELSADEEHAAKGPADLRRSTRSPTPPPLHPAATPSPPVATPSPSAATPSPPLAIPKRRRKKTSKPKEPKNPKVGFLLVCEERKLLTHTIPCLTARTISMS